MFQVTQVFAYFNKMLALTNAMLHSDSHKVTVVIIWVTFVSFCTDNFNSHVHALFVVGNEVDCNLTISKWHNGNTKQMLY